MTRDWGNDRVVRRGEQILSRRDTKRPAVRLGTLLDRALGGAVVGGVVGLAVKTLVVTVNRGMGERDRRYTSMPCWLVAPALTVGSLRALLGRESMFGAGTASGIGRYAAHRAAGARIRNRDGRRSGRGGRP